MIDSEMTTAIRSLVKKHFGAEKDFLVKIAETDSSH